MWHRFPLTAISFTGRELQRLLFPPPAAFIRRLPHSSSLETPCSRALGSHSFSFSSPEKDNGREYSTFLFFLFSFFAYYKTEWLELEHNSCWFCFLFFPLLFTTWILSKEGARADVFFSPFFFPRSFRSTCRRKVFVITPISSAPPPPLYHIGRFVNSLFPFYHDSNSTELTHRKQIHRRILPLLREKRAVSSDPLPLFPPPWGRTLGTSGLKRGRTNTMSRFPFLPSPRYS